MADVNIDGVVTWLKNWFYDKTEIGTLLNAKANLNQSQANYNVVTDGSGNITVEPKPTIPTTVSELTDSNAHSNIGSNANDTQATINTAIDTKLGQLSNIDALVMVDTLPTATANTMGKLYVINENSKINFYWTKRSGTSGSYTYAWEKMDTDILDELVVNWTDVQNKPSTFTPSSHTHGNISNDGKIGTTGGNILVTGANGIIGTSGTLSSTKITDSSAHTEIGTSANATQSTINTYINNKLMDKGAKTDLVDWTYNSNGFTNGVKLVSKTDNANGRITLHMQEVDQLDYETPL